MIPLIFARAVEREVAALGVCADYLEDCGKDGAILRLIADNYFILDDSGYDVFFGCNHYGDWGDDDCYGNGYYYGIESGSGYGVGYDYYGMRNWGGNGRGGGYGYSPVNGDGYGGGYGGGYSYPDGNSRLSVSLDDVPNYENLDIN